MRAAHHRLRLARALGAVLALTLVFAAPAWPATAKTPQTPSRAVMAKRYLTITKRVNDAGNAFVLGTLSLLNEKATGAKIYVKAVKPFAKVLASANTVLVGFHAQGSLRKDVNHLIAIDKKTIRDLKTVAKVKKPAGITAWQAVISNDENTTAVYAEKVRDDIG